MSNNEYSFDDMYGKFTNFVRGSVDSAKDFFTSSFRLGVFEEPDRYVVEAVLPGVEKDRISVTMDEGTLDITVNPRQRAEGEAPVEGYFRSERADKTLHREAYLPDIQEDTLSARMEDGILYITALKFPQEDTSTTINID